jgi:hypothetical protein
LSSYRRSYGDRNRGSKQRPHNETIAKPQRQTLCCTNGISNDKTVSCPIGVSDDVSIDRNSVYRSIGSAHVYSECVPISRSFRTPFCGSFVQSFM